MWVFILITIIVIIFILFKNQGSPKATNKSVLESYWKHRRNHPGLDEHQYLADVYRHRKNISNIIRNESSLNKDTLDDYAYSLTYLFSILSPPDSIKALAYHIIYQEDPKSLESVPEYLDE